MKKNTLYLLLGIGAAYWYWMKYMKAPANNIKTPGFPEIPSSPQRVPTPETQEGSDMIQVFNNPDQDHTAQNYYTETGTYQNFYGKINGTTKKVPTTC